MEEPRRIRSKIGKNYVARMDTVDESLRSKKTKASGSSSLSQRNWLLVDRRRNDAVDTADTVSWWTRCASNDVITAEIAYR